jgi:VCBS repeat protein
VVKRSSPARFVIDQRNKLAPITFALGFLCLTLVAGFLSGAAVAAALPDASSPASRHGLPFAIADFDGDSRPDLARLEAGASDSAYTEYWIQLQLSTARWESIRLVAPAGGLQLVARDVNGDEFVDLVVSTVWSNRPVAVYLNDGHGTFTHAEPAAFPGAFSDAAATIWSSGGNLATESVAVPSAAPPGICAGGKDLSCERAPAAVILLSIAGFPNSPLLFLRAGRAPPFDISHS